MKAGMIVSHLAVIFVFMGTALAGNFNADQCSLGGGCLQCVSSRVSEVERCQQLYFLITLSTNHPTEREQYCTENCPIVLATAYYYCGISNSQSQALFEECSSYNVQPTGEEDFSNIDAIGSCVSFNRNRRCESCIQSGSSDLLRCLQHSLLMQYTNNTAYRGSFCEGSCPLTLLTSDWYCSGSSGAFQECRMNENGRFCADVVDEINNDNDYIQCLANRASCNLNCVAAINKYGCCLSQFNFNGNCNLSDCDVETGGSPSHLATPLIFFTMLASAIFM